MATAKGANAQVVIQEETAYATDPTSAAAEKIYFVTCDLSMDRPNEQDDTIQADRNPSKPSRGLKNPHGTLTVNLQANIGRLLKGLMGSVTTTGEGPYVHTFKVGSSLPPFVVEKGFTDIDQYFKYNGMKVGGFNMTLAKSGPQPLSFNLIGAAETASGTAYDSTPTDNGYQPFDGLSLATIEEGGSTIAAVTALDLNIDNELGDDDADYVLGGAGSRTTLDEGMFRVSGTLTALFEDLSLYNKGLNFTESSLNLGWELGTGAGSAGNESFEIKIPELVYEQKSPPVSGPRGVRIELGFTGYYSDSVEESTVQMILRNTLASYA